MTSGWRYFKARDHIEHMSFHITLCSVYIPFPKIYLQGHLIDSYGDVSFVGYCQWVNVKNLQGKLAETVQNAFSSFYSPANES